MTNELARWRGGSSARHSTGVLSGLTGAVGGLVMLVALVAGLALAVLFAATLAVVTALATLLLALTALAWRVRPRPVAQRALSRPVGHAWVTYGIDRSRR